VADRSRVPERVAEGVYRLDAIGLRHAISVLLLENDDGWTLVDTGLAGSVQRIKDTLDWLGSGPEGLKRIFITHQHDDHTGGLKGLLNWAPEAEVGASGHEALVVSGERGMDAQSNPALRFAARSAKPPGVPVGKVLGEGDLVSGFRVIATPGHSLGHVSLLRDEDGLLFTADAFGCMPKRLRVGVRKAFCTDPALAKVSAARLLRESFGDVYFSHGGPLLAGDSDPKAFLRKAVAECRY
jgi:glyoxylase-like metal-dependent hydrolase (beta-lactamase superfamily II)